MSIKLTLILSGRTLDRFEFDDFARLRVGRSEDCEVRIDNLGVSRHHCEIVRQEGYVVLRDLQSNNGTFVNGGKVEVHNLNDGDVITLGKYSLEYQGPPPPGAKGLLVSEASEPDGALTVQVDPAALARMAGGKATRVRGHFVLEPRGKEKPRTLVLEKPVFLLGKDQDADLRLEGWFCPRVVAVVLRDDTGFRLLDVTERGDAVRVNGTKRRDVRLTDQDEVQVRDRRLRFLRGSPNAADA